LGWAARNPFPGLVQPLEKPLTYKRVLALDVVDLVPPVPSWNPKGGYWHIIVTDSKGNSRHFRSYRGRFIECYLGWRINGYFGAALRHALAKGF
jgi:hypothetical protein